MTTATPLSFEATLLTARDLAREPVETHFRPVERGMGALRRADNIVTVCLALMLAVALVQVVWGVWNAIHLYNPLTMAWLDSVSHGHINASSSQMLSFRLFDASVTRERLLPLATVLILALALRKPTTTRCALAAALVLAPWLGLLGYLVPGDDPFRAQRLTSAFEALTTGALDPRYWFLAGANYTFSALGGVIGALLLRFRVRSDGGEFMPLAHRAALTLSMLVFGGVTLQNGWASVEALLRITSGFLDPVYWQNTGTLLGAFVLSALTFYGLARMRTWAALTGFATTVVVLILVQSGVPFWDRTLLVNSTVGSSAMALLLGIGLTPIIWHFVAALRRAAND